MKDVLTVPLDVVWDNPEKTILLHTYTGGWTVEDYDHLVTRVRAHVLQVSHAVDHIVDVTRSSSPPLGISARVVHATENQLPNERFAVMVGLKRLPVALFMFQSVLRFAPQHQAIFRFADSVEEARALLAQPQPSD
jgi:hypothetical protein